MWQEIKKLPKDASNAGVRAVATRGHKGKPPRELLVKEGDLVIWHKWHFCGCENTQLINTAYGSLHQGEYFVPGRPLVVPWRGRRSSWLGPCPLCPSRWPSPSCCSWSSWWRRCGHWTTILTIKFSTMMPPSNVQVLRNNSLMWLLGWYIFFEDWSKLKRFSLQRNLR